MYQAAIRYCVRAQAILSYLSYQYDEHTFTSSSAFERMPSFELKNRMSESEVRKFDSPNRPRMDTAIWNPLYFYYIFTIFLLVLYVIAGMNNIQQTNGNQMSCRLLRKQKHLIFL